MKSKRRGPYTKYTNTEKNDIAVYAIDNSAAAAIRKFKTIHPNLNESTVRGFVNQFKTGPKVQDGKKKTRPPKLGFDLDEMVINEVREHRANGVAIFSSLVIGIGKGVVRGANNPSMRLEEDGGHIRLTKAWALSLFQRIGYTKRHATTGKVRLTAAYTDEVSLRFTSKIAADVKKHSIPEELIINWDQTPLKYVPCGQWTMAEKGSSKVALAGLSDKRAITGVLASSAAGDMLPFQLIYPGKTERCHPVASFPGGFSIVHNKNHWSTGETMVLYIQTILAPYIQKTRVELGVPNMPAIIIYDAFSAHCLPEVQSELNELNVLHHPVPAHLTDLLQPLDLSVNKPVKDFLRGQFVHWLSDLVKKTSTEGSSDDISDALKSSTLLRNEHAKWMIGCYEYFQLPDQRRIIRNGFAKAGILDAIKCGPQEMDIFAEVDPLP